MLPITQSGHYRNITTNPGRVAGIIMQQFEGVDAQQLDYTGYNIGADAMNNYWRTGLYAGSMKDAQVMINKAIAEENRFYEGAGKVILATALANVASYFGDVPWTEALKGTEFLKPQYDDQEAVYDAALGLFDEAIAAFGAATGDMYTGGDVVYDGDTDLWIKTTRGLKARYLMQLQKRRDVVSEVISLVGQSISGVSEEARLTFGTAETENWTLAKFARERPNTLVIDNRFADWMTSREDPRMDNYMKFDGSVWQYWILGDADLTWALDNASVPLISYAEIKFLEAEALARQGGSAEAALEEAITASMELVGIPVDSAADYIAANSSLSGSMEEQVESIMVEAYFAYYGHNFSQTWANYRRTGYPELTPSPGGGSEGLNPSGVIPQRYLYPDSEQTTNRENFEAAQARQNGALLDVPVWAFQ